MAWNLARNIKVTDPKLFEMMKYCLLRTLRQCQLIIEFCQGLNKEVKWHGRQESEAAHYCDKCEVEVFNILFVVEQERKFVVHCLDCAKKISPTLEDIVVLNQFRMEELMEVYDNFQLGTVFQSHFHLSRNLGIEEGDAKK
jgi:histone demethylase